MFPIHHILCVSIDTILETEVQIQNKKSKSLVSVLHKVISDLLQRMSVRIPQLPTLEPIPEW